MKIIIELEVEQRPYDGFNSKEKVLIDTILGRHLSEGRSKNFGNVWGSPDLIARMTSIKVKETKTP